MAKNENVVGASFELDIANLQKGLKEAKQSISLTTSEFQKSTAGMNSWQKTAVGLSAKVTELSSNLEKQDDVVKNVRKQYELTKKQYGENSQEAQKLLIQLNKEEATYKKIDNQLNDYTDRLDKVRNAEKKMTDELEETNKSTVKATKYFNKITSSMVDWKSNTDGVKAKIGQLNTILPKQKELVDKLAQEYTDLVKSQNYSKEEATALKNEWQKQNGVLSSLKQDIDKYEKSLNDLIAEQEKGKRSTKEFDGAMSNLSSSIVGGAKKAILGLTATVTGYITSLVAVSESTREYRTDLSKLESNAKSAGVSLELTKEELKKLNAITGETDSNIEALSNLMMAGFKDNNLQEAVDTLSNAVIKFPDTLKVESLADSLQESIKQMEMGNNATGQYAELLERLGYSLEDVTEKTNKKKTLEEKQAYLLELVNKKIGGTTDAYREQNSELVDAADAQFELNDAMAQLGEKAEPAISLVKNRVAELIKEFVNWVSANVDLEVVTNRVMNGIETLATEILPLLIKGIKTTLEIGEKLLPLIIGVGSAILTYNAYVKTATVVTKAYNIITTVLKAGMLLLKGATIAQTQAQLGLNAAMKANLFGIVTAAVVGLTAGIVALIKYENKATKEAKLQTAAVEDETEAVREQVKAREELKESVAETIANGTAELDYVASLKDELDGLVDKNGKVKKGYEDRAKFIVGELSEATGVEISLIDGEIKKYDELGKKIDQIIEKKKAQLVLEANEELYKDAIQQEQAAYDEMYRIAQEREQVLLEMQALEKEYEENRYTWKGQQIAKQMEQLDKQYGLLDEQYTEQQGLAEDNAYIIGTYEDQMVKFQKGAYDEIKAEDMSLTKHKANKNKTDKQIAKEELEVANNKLTRLLWLQIQASDDEKHIYDSQIEAAKKNVEEKEKTLKALTSTVEDGNENVNEAWKEGLEKQIKTLTGKDVEFKDAGDGQVQAYIDGVEYKKPVAVSEAQTLADDIIAEFDMSEEAKEQGKNTTKGLGNGIEEESNKKSFADKVKGVASKILGWLSKGLVLGSPSKETKKYGKWLVQGLGIGIDNEENKLLNQVKSFSKNVLGSFNDEINSGLDSVKGSINTSLDINGSSASNSGTGNQVVNNFYQTINSPKPVDNLTVYRQTKSILKSAKGGLSNV